MESYDVVVVGSGTGGSSAASQAHRRGKTVGMIEEWLVGGLCNTRGCIPTKALLASARAVRAVRHAPALGVPAHEPEPDFGAVMERAGELAHTRSANARKWIEGMGTLIEGTAEVARPGVVRVGDLEIGYGALIVATGSAPFIPDVEGLAGVRYETSDTIWSLDALPAAVAILGGGAVSVEFASFFSAMGSRVVVLERSGRILSREDEEVCAGLARMLSADGIEIRYGTTVERLEEVEAGVRVHFRDVSGSPETRDASLLLVATGRRPKVTGLGLEHLGLDVERGGIAVDETGATGVLGVWAAGDVVGGYQLTDVAYHQGMVAGVNASGGEARTDLRVVPRAIFSYPEVGSVGLTEAEARERFGDETIVAKTPLWRAGKAQADAATEGLVKLVAAPDGEVVGAHFLGGPASEIVQVAAMAMVGGVVLDELKTYIPIHPTYAEAINIAALKA